MEPSAESTEPRFQFNQSADVFFVHRLALERVQAGDERYRLLKKKLSSVVDEIIWNEQLDFAETATFEGEEHGLMREELTAQRSMRCPEKRDWLHACFILRSMGYQPDGVQ